MEILRHDGSTYVIMETLRFNGSWFLILFLFYGLPGLFISEATKDYVVSFLNKELNDEKSIKNSKVYKISSFFSGVVLFIVLIILTLVASNTESFLINLLLFIFSCAIHFFISRLIADLLLNKELPKIRIKQKKLLDELINEKNKRGETEIKEKIKLYDDVKRIYIELSDDGKRKIGITESGLNFIHNDFEKLLIDREKEIIQIEKLENKSYLHQFIKISNFINQKRINIQSKYEKIKKTRPEKFVRMYSFWGGIDMKRMKTDIIKEYEDLEKSIIQYQQLIFHGVNMISALINNKHILFYQIYEFFDGIGIYETHWQKDISGKMDNNERALNRIELNTEIGLENLTYCFQNSFLDLEKSITRELESINSNIDYNGMLLAIQNRELYQMRN
jgi:hypothetical protein